MRDPAQRFYLLVLNAKAACTWCYFSGELPLERTRVFDANTIEIEIIVNVIDDSGATPNGLQVGFGSTDSPDSFELIEITVEPLSYDNVVRI